MAANVRRTWDKQAYEEKARARAEAEAEEGVPANAPAAAAKDGAKRMREEFVAAEPGAAGPEGSARAFVRARDGDSLLADLESKAGTTQIVTAAALEAGVGAGYWCEVCSSLLKDSSAYLNHVNGKKHQKALGFSMRVERVGADVVKSKLEALKLKLASASGAGASSSAAAAAAVTAAAAAPIDESRNGEEAARKKKRALDAEARRKEREAEELQDVDPEIAELMGFGGFGGGKRR
jgi:U4/U6.U5 tri-snRNP component SNU23